MARVMDHLDAIEQKIMSGLKDFQEATVERIDYLYRHNQYRILVSDEVGLGKTLIARGTVAKLAKLRREEGDNLFKVVYICSNAAIADQNLSKLRVTHETKTESASSSRLSMQHLNIFKQENDAELLDRYIQLIPLTPDTSFRMTAGTGIVRERALMFVHLKRMPELNNYQKELEVAMMDIARSTWESWCKDWYEREAVNCNDKSGGRYFDYMQYRLHSELSMTWHDDVTYLDGLVELCDAIRRNGGKRVSENAIIGQLRVIFAKISLEKLEPDLVIMDEFQRFKYLLNSDPESETGMLANKFFHARDVRMLLLSATPYKMYSTSEEIDETRLDEHYTEFLSVMNFLNEDSEAGSSFLTVWRDYSIRLKELTLGGTTILSAKNAAEDAMYQTVCRTERISAAENADIIDDSDVHEPLEVLEQDIRSYVQAQELLDQIGANYHVPVDYIKSTPYLMSFMRDYQLKRNVEKYFKEHPQELRKINKDTFWINRNTIDHYERVPNNNARLERVMNSVLQRGVDKLLWMPPSKPYYEMEGAYKNTEFSTKTLIFSTWEMVPRMLASLLSYEVERKTVGKLARDYQDRDVHYFYSGEKRYPSARMNFSVRNGVPSAMTLFCLIYPSWFLASCYDPVSCMNERMGIREIQRQAREKISEELKKLPSPEHGNQDRRWYYIVPLIMDGNEYASSWIESGLKSAEEQPDYDDEEGKSKRQKGFIAHMEALKELFDDTHKEQYDNLGRRPDDLLDVLTDMAIASPAICIYRTYLNYTDGEKGLPVYLPSQLARVFINRMNTVESTAVVELVCGRKSDDAHWQNLLTYCRQGNLQAVFDEYAHLISNGIDHDEDLIHQLHTQMKGAMDIRTTQYNVDTYKSFQKRSFGQKDRPTNIRTHFAVAFTKGEGKDTDGDRKKTIRDAFNSPFRPFVLATTSIGQEGLDFHNYCRKIVHWNLPSNPIDLEQREGRINRFECLAIRQNVAKRYGNIVFSTDVWKEMFDEATIVEKAGGSSDLIPFWGLRETEDMVKIERIVPMYPFSRDGLTYERLIKILSLYRLTLGQARQEELLEYLFKNCDDPDQLKELFINLSPFYKEQKRKKGG
ncbi:MAG: hypothetical protein IJ225_00705 [Solobacterium sp.]|nr:hypothetical protein [Solobacterium sp.]